MSVNDGVKSKSQRCLWALIPFSPQPSQNNLLLDVDIIVVLLLYNNKRQQHIVCVSGAINDVR